MNRHFEEITIELNGITDSTVTGRILQSGKLQGHNSVDQPQKVKPVPFNDAGMESGNLRLTLSPFSVVVRELRK